MAAALKERYDRDGYTEAQVTSSYDNGVLTLRVDEGRIDDVEVTGLAPRAARRVRDTLEDGTPRVQLFEWTAGNFARVTLVPVP